MIRCKNAKDFNSTTLFTAIPANAQLSRRRTASDDQTGELLSLCTGRALSDHNWIAVAGIRYQYYTQYAGKAVLLMSILTAAMNNGRPNWGSLQTDAIGILIC